MLYHYLEQFSQHLKDRVQEQTALRPSNRVTFLPVNDDHNVRLDLVVDSIPNLLYHVIVIRCHLYFQVQSLKL